MTLDLDLASQQRIDALIGELADGEHRWARTSLAQRADLLRRTHQSVAEESDAWVEAACRIKQLPPGSPLAGEEWSAGPYSTLWGLSALAETLERIAAGGAPLDGVTLAAAPGGRVAVPVLPRTMKDRIAFSGFRGEVWMTPGLSESEVRNSAGLGALDPARTDGVGLVLGAGNITSITPLDVLYELIAHNRVVLLKVNPILDQLTPVLTRALAPLVEHGVLRIVSGDGAVGGYLAKHPGIGHVHITGSVATHDLVAFGSGEEGARRRAAGVSVLDKPLTSELGGVSPVIIVPGKWSRADLRFQAEHVATQRLHNSGHNCIATQVVVLSSDWAQKDDFLAELRKVLDTAQDRVPWYPGAAERLERLAVDTGAARLGPRQDRLLIDLDAGAADDFASTEAFATALGVRTLPGEGAEFLAAAVDFSNDELLGTLGASILIDPATERALGRPLDELLEPLRYGNISVNAWTLLGFAAPYATWGAYPGHTLQDAQSGIGIVHNAYLLDGVERTVVHGPFRPFPLSIAGGELALSPKPLWFVTSRSGALTGQRLAEYGAEPTWRRLLAVAMAAMRA